MKQFFINEAVPEDKKAGSVSFLYYTDTHYQEKAPQNRIDDFLKTEFGKLHELKALADKYSVDYYLMGGDFFNRGKVSESFLSTVIKEWGFSSIKEERKLLDEGKQTKDAFIKKLLNYRPTIGVAGNHDLIGASLASTPKTALGVLSASGFIELVDQENDYTIPLKNGKTIRVTGIPYELDLMKKGAPAFLLKEKKADLEFVLVHEALYSVPEELRDNYPAFMPITDVAPQNEADVVLIGHVHTGFGQVIENNTLYANVGSIAQTIVKKEHAFNRAKALIITVTEDLCVYTQEEFIGPDKPEELFDLEYFNEKANTEAQLKLVEEKLSAIEKREHSSLQELLETVAKNDAVDSHSTELAKEKLQSVLEREGTEQFLDSKRDYRIKRITLKNFESHSNTTIDLTDGTNLIIGESSSGKSSIVRALSWCLEDEGDSKTFLRTTKDNKEKTVSVSVEYEDGLIITRELTVAFSKNGERKPKKNGWLVVYPDGTEESFNTKGLELIQKLAGISYLDLGSNDRLKLNLRKQDDPYYFIAEKGTDKAAIIGSLYGTQHLSTAIKELESDRKAFLRENTLLKKELNEYLEELSQYESLSQQKDLFLKVQKACSAFEKEESLLKQLSALANEYKRTMIRLKKLDTIIGVDYKALIILHNELEKDYALYKLISTDYKNYKTVIEQQSKNTVLIKEKDALTALDKRLIACNELDKQCAFLEKAKNDYSSIKKSLNKLETLIKSKQTVEANSVLLKELQKEYDRYKELNALRTEFQKSKEALEKVEKKLAHKETVEHLTAQLSAFNEKKEQLLLLKRELVLYKELLEKEKAVVDSIKKQKEELVAVQKELGASKYLVYTQLTPTIRLYGIKGV